jgi:hypothetical protein
MKINYEGLDIDVEIIGGFKFNNKEYAVCSYADAAEIYKIVIVEFFKNGDKFEIREIPDNEFDLVLEKYKEIEMQILGGDYID